MNSRTFETTGRVLTAAVAALTALALSTGAASAQEGTVTGQVVDASNLEPVVGAQVFFPDLDEGTLTNEEGRYRITGVPAGSHEVRVRLLGYRSANQNVTVESGETATADFQLSVSAVSLGEIVVTQTGEQEARELGRAVTTIDAGNEVERSKSRTVNDLIKGRSTGTVVRSSSGSVGTGSNFNIRGNTTLSLGNTPLIYIDGVRVSNDNVGIGGMGQFFTGGQQSSRLNDLSPEDIESIQVLKGPSATTLYGSEAASGVLVIETKQGSGDESRWTGRAQVGGNWDSTDWPSVAYNPTDDITVPLGGLAKDTTYLMNLLEGKEAGIAPPFRTGLEQNHAGTVRGGFADGDVNYYASAGYEALEGNLPGNRVDKWNARGNFQLSPSEDVDVSLSSGFTSNTTHLPQNDNNSFGVIGQALIGLGFFAPMNRVDPVAGGDPVRTCPLAFELATGPNRDAGAPLGAISDANCAAPFFGLTFDEAALTSTTDDTQRFLGSGTLTARPWDFLTTRLTVGYDEFDQDGTQITPDVPSLVSFSEAFEGSLSRSKTRGTNLTLQGTSTADFELSDEVTSSTTAGVQWFDEQQTNIFITCQDFPAGSPACDNSRDLLKTGGEDFFTEERTLGIFGEQQFAWRNRLFVTGGVRIDNNSAFGENLDAEVLPNASLSYVMSDEEWFPEFFEQFKVRGAWGQSAEQPGTNDAFTLLAANPTPFQGTRQIGIAPAQPGNPELSVATVTEVEAGMEMSILEGRLSGEFTWYRQTTEDDVVARALPPSAGFPSSQFDNVGELINTGVEASLNATAFSTADLTWDWTAQVSTNYNEITELDNPIDLGFTQRHAEGQAFGAYFAPGFFVEEPGGEVQETDGSGFEIPGIPGFDGGQPTPNVNGSLSTTVTLFNHVTLYSLAEMATGHHIDNNTAQFVCGSAVHRCANVFDVGPDGQLTDESRVKRAAADGGGELNFVEEADYVKLRTVSVRFDLPDDWTRFMSGQDVSLQLTGENLATFTGYSLDPELTVAGQTQAFFSDFLTLPPAKRVTASMQVSF
ncbi:MAG: SusC/RagA family TonB-linked outer membrane protein [Gemmatimonadota bacterium]